MNIQESGQRIYFSLEQAQRVLTTLQKPLKKLMKIKKSIEIYDLIDVDFNDDDYTEHLRNLRINKQFHKLHFEFFRLLEDIESTGAILKDLDLGLIDFHSQFQGKEILLCWKFGEDKIRHWHDIDEGYGTRKPILFLEEELRK